MKVGSMFATGRVPVVDGNPSSSARAGELAHGLYPHQIEGLAFLLGRRRSILADDMGLGKTRQSVLSIVEAEPVGPYLVVCPASIKHNWEREIHMVLPRAETAIVGPDDPPAVGYGGWVIINYDNLKKHINLLGTHPWTAFVFDEAHYLKNHRTVRSFLAFSKRYCDGQRNDYGHWVSAGSSNMEELAVQLHGIMLRRTKDEVLDLPPKLRTWIDVDIHELVREKLNEAVRSFLGSPTEEPERDQRGRRRGIGQLSSARRTLAAVKAKQTCEFLDGVVDQGEKVLVFSAFVNPIQRFSKHFGEQAVTITGETPVGQRQGLVDRFQTDDSVRVYVGQIHAGGTGVNLTAARQVVFNDLDWVPANHWQAEDRAYRIGQTGTVNVTYMVARGTIEEFVRTVLETKARIVDDLVEGKALGADITCDCKGFSYRGACNHSRTLKDTLVSGERLPDEYEKVE
jgi:SNF2 family DNA or RNA helicase